MYVLKKFKTTIQEEIHACYNKRGLDSTSYTFNDWERWLKANCNPQKNPVVLKLQNSIFKSQNPGLKLPSYNYKFQHRGSVLKNDDNSDDIPWIFDVHPPGGGKNSRLKTPPTSRRRASYDLKFSSDDIPRKYSSPPTSRRRASYDMKFSSDDIPRKYSSPPTSRRITSYDMKFSSDDIPRKYSSENRQNIRYNNKDKSSFSNPKNIDLLYDDVTMRNNSVRIGNMILYDSDINSRTISENLNCNSSSLQSETDTQKHSETDTQKHSETDTQNSLAMRYSYSITGRKKLMSRNRNMNISLNSTSTMISSSADQNNMKNSSLNQKCIINSNINVIGRESVINPDRKVYQNNMNTIQSSNINESLIFSQNNSRRTSPNSDSMIYEYGNDINGNNSLLSRDQIVFRNNVITKESPGISEVMIFSENNIRNSSLNSDDISDKYCHHDINENNFSLSRNQMISQNGDISKESSDVMNNMIFSSPDNVVRHSLPNPNNMIYTSYFINGTNSSVSHPNEFVFQNKITSESLNVSDDLIACQTGVVRNSSLDLESVMYMPDDFNKVNPENWEETLSHSNIKAKELSSCIGNSVSPQYKSIKDLPKPKNMMVINDNIARKISLAYPERKRYFQDNVMKNSSSRNNSRFFQSEETSRSSPAYCDKMRHFQPHVNIDKNRMKIENGTWVYKTESPALKKETVWEFGYHARNRIGINQSQAICRK